MGTIKDIKYKLVKNFLTKEEVNLAAKYCQMKHVLNDTKFDFLQNKNGDTYFYGDPLMESIMLNKLPLMEKETGLELLPTYAFWRMYTLNADLRKHKDRPSCEVSVTVMLGSDGTKWPIFIEDKPIDLNPGEAVIYLGCELNHHREEFKGDWHAQTFLHYVDKNGKNTEWYKDKRQYWSQSK